MKYCLFIFLFFISTSFAIEHTCHVLGTHQSGTQTYRGPTWCDKAEVNNLIVHGSLQADNTALLGVTTVAGPLKADHSTFYVIHIDNQSTKAIVNLGKHSVVENDIVFEGKKGIVILDHTSIVKGKIVNASVVG